MQKKTIIDGLPRLQLQQIFLQNLLMLSVLMLLIEHTLGCPYLKPTIFDSPSVKGRPGYPQLMADSLTLYASFMLPDKANYLLFAISHLFSL
nr:hypothetical protein [Alcanivorax sp. 1008]